MRAKTFTPSGVRFKGQTVGLYTQSEWASRVEIEKTFNAFRDNWSPGAGFYIYYTVPRGKILFVNGVSFYGFATAVAERDLNQVIAGRLEDATVPDVKTYYGANAGSSVVFTTPVRIEGGHEIRAYLFNLSGHNMNIRLSFWGYEEAPLELQVPPDLIGGGMKMSEGLKALKNGNFRSMTQLAGPDNSLIIILNVGGGVVYRFQVRDLYGPNELVLEDNIPPEKCPFPEGAS